MKCCVSGLQEVLWIAFAIQCSAVHTFAADSNSAATVPEESQNIAVKWYQLQNVTIPPDCALRSQANITKPPSIFVEIKKNGQRILQSTTEKGWTVDYPKKGHVFEVVDDPDAIYTIQVWDNCWWNQNICNITGLRGNAFSQIVYQKGGQYDTKEQLLSVQFKEVKAP